ncbi:MAG TPA: thiamine diphosphokinase [Deltaproteobacteria bacterium]|nr:thiamine diphosphokinase [Deltaproteobacteria bacterium]
MMSVSVLVISGGDMADPDRIGRDMREYSSPVLVCADGGARYAAAAGVVPAAVIGDMDSVDAELLSYYESRGSVVIRYPVSKNETDTELALRYALSLEPKEIRLYAALGGRIDHTLANISLLSSSMLRCVDTRIIDDRGELFAVDDRAVVRGSTGQTVSLLPLTTEVSGITLEGFEYPLCEATMEPGRPYGISNRLAGTEGRIQVRSGRLLVIHYSDAGGEAGATSM